MKTISLTTKQFETLSTYKLPPSVHSTESDLFIVDLHGKRTVLFKRLLRIKGEYFENKLLTINTLIENAEEIGIRQLILPEEIVAVDGQVVGFIMRFIKNNINLSSLLNDSSISLSSKKKYLMAVGELLKKVHSIKYLDGEFFLSDIHEDNFIIDRKDGTLYAVDLDSCKIGNNKPFLSNYLLTNVNLSGSNMPRDLLDKYPINSDGIHIPNVNTEWLCYITLILNFIAKGPIHRLTIDQFHKYLDYLDSLSFPKELLECFARIYTPEDNNLPIGLINEIPNDYERANFDTFVNQFVLRK